jgi:hypothetical protein
MAAARTAQLESTAMNLRELVEKYRALAGGFGKPLPLAAFGLARPEAERLFSAFDEDYHISRFLRFSIDPALQNNSDKIYLINGFAQSHLAMDAGIETIL